MPVVLPPLALKNIFFGRKRCKASLGGSYDHLSDFRAGHVSGTEYTWHGSLFHGIGYYTFVFGGLYCALEEVYYRLASVEIHKDARQFERAFNAVQVFELYSLYKLAALDRSDRLAGNYLQIRNGEVAIVACRS